MNKQGKIFYGWWVVLGLLIVEMLSQLGRFNLTAFFPFISSELGWSRTTIGLGQSVTVWMYGIFVLLTGRMTDRFGGRKTILIGGFLSIGGWLLLATIKTPWQYYFYYGVVLALAVSLTHAVPAQATIRKWFIKRAGFVTGLSTAAVAGGQAIFVPVLAVMAGSIGWRTTSVISAFVFGITIILCALLVIRDTPESIGLHPDGETPASTSRGSPLKVQEDVSVKESMRTLALWLLVISYAIRGIPWMGVMGHIAMWGVDLGSTAASAGILVTAITVPAVVARIGGGWLGDRYGKKPVIIISGLFSTLVMLWAWQGVQTMQSLIIFAMLFGLAYSIPMGLYSPYLGDLFGRANIGFLFGLLTAGWGLVGGFGPSLWGKLFELSGSYNLASLTSAVCFVIAGVAVIFIKPKAARD